jgi:beta-xylosidase
VGYATAKSVDGPWTYRGVILAKDPAQGILATGHHSIVQVPGTDDWYIAYHRFGMPGGDGQHRETTIDRLFFTADGTIAKVVPTLTSVQPVVPLTPAPKAVKAPQVQGKTVAGYALTGTPGAWNQTGLSFEYQWLRDGSWVPGATAKQYRLTQADVGHRFAVQVTAVRRGAAPATALSPATAAVRSLP